MGNCVFRGTCELNNINISPSSEVARTIKVITANGGVMELFPPITAECITNEFPNHAIFTTQQPLLHDHPLLHTDTLCLGHSYFLLPINKSDHLPICTSTLSSQPQRICCATPYRMSLDTPSQQSHHRKRCSSSSDCSGMEITSLTPRSSRNNNGVWKVKLVISPEQLSEILAKEATTEELVESLRTVAKCGNNYGSFASAANSDKWSISGAHNQCQQSTLSPSIYGSSL